MRGLSLEIRVGLLVMVAVLLLGGFVAVLSGVGFGGGYRLFVDFDNPGNIKTGAPVVIGGMRVGTVDEIAYLGGAKDPETGRRALIRTTVLIDEGVKHTIHEDALFYVTSQSVLGEQVIAIDPGSHDKPLLPQDAKVHGVDPPRLDLALALGYELLENVVEALRGNRENLGNTLENAGAVLAGLREIMDTNKPHIDSIFADVAGMAREGHALAATARETAEGEEVRRILANLDQSLSTVSKDLGPILDETRTLAESANATLGPDQQAQLRETLSRVATLSTRADQTMTKAQGWVNQIDRGEGTVGALLKDEEIYDDLQEMLRDLKHNPWKFFWRE